MTSYSASTAEARNSSTLGDAHFQRGCRVEHFASGFGGWAIGTALGITEKRRKPWTPIAEIVRPQRNWTVGLAAAALVLISVGGYFYHREQLAAIAADHLRLIVTGPSSLLSGVAADYVVSTTAIGGQPFRHRSRWPC